jgi:hypothetical protein
MSGRTGALDAGERHHDPEEQRPTPVPTRSVSSGSEKGSSRSGRRGRSDIVPSVPRLLAAVFVVTGTIWLVQHLEKWPGGYLPWMLTLAFALMTVSAFLRFHEMRKQRDAAHRDLMVTFDSLRYRFSFKGVAGVAFRHPQAPEGKQTGYAFMLGLYNGASEPIEYEMKSVSIVMDSGDTALPQEAASNEAIVLPGETHEYGYPDIYAPIDPLLNGRIEATILYRHPKDRRTFSMHYNAKIVVRTPQTAGIVPNVTFHPILEGKVTHDLVIQEGSE